MVDLKILEQRGVSAEAWKPLLRDLHQDFTHLYTNALEKPTGDKERRQRFHNRLRSRIQSGVNYNLQNYRQIYALDLIWDTPFRQVSPTLLAAITDRCKTDADVLNALRGFGYDLEKLQLDLNEKDPKTGQTKRKLNVPAFISIVVPLVRAYLTARKARIVNDHNLKPFIQYQSEINTPQNRVKAEIISDAGDVQARQFNYLNTLDQAVHKMLLYGTGVLLPREQWFAEKQLRFKEGDSPTSDATEEYVVREGIRYHCPHPSRFYYDQAYPLRALNTDTGPVWAGYWKVMRYKEVLDNTAFYNTDRIYPGRTEWWNSASHFFATVYASCVVNIPKLSITDMPSEVKDRETWLANNFFYNNELLDSSVVLCEHFERLVPKDEGLGDYEYPIWARFVVAGDGTIVYGAPVGYAPAVIFKDNGDDSRLEEASQGLTLTPYQDQVQNLLVQYLIAVRQNLANLTLIDENVVSQETIDIIRNLGENFYRSLNVYRADLRELSTFGQHNVNSAVMSWKFPFLDTNGILQAIRTVLDLAERVLNFSSQEVGQAATHEQTQDEVQLIAQSNDNILRYTSIAVDQGISAWGNQLYEARMGYGTDDFFAQLPLEIPLTAAQLSDMGITVLDTPVKPGEKLSVKVKKTALQLGTFATVPPVIRRITNNALVRDLTVFFRDLMNNPLVAQSVGPDQALMVINAIADLAELPLPAKLRNVGGAQEQAMAQQLVAFQEDVRKAIENIGAALTRNTQSIAAIAQNLGLQLPSGNQQPTPQPG